MIHTAAQFIAEADPKAVALRNAGYIFLFCLAAVMALRYLMRRSRKAREEDRSGPPRRASARAESPPAAGPGSTRDPEVSRLYIELNDFARELEGRLDTKIAYLKRLISDAEKVLVALNEAIASARAPTPPAKVEEPPPAPPAPPPPLIDVLIGGGEPAGAGAGAKTNGQAALKSRILTLWGEGKPEEAIADEVGIPQGEVELVLSLHRASQKRPPVEG